MKKTIVAAAILFFGVFTCLSQSIERSVVASSGDYFEGAGISLSWTLGEIATEAYTSGNTILTQGFQQPDITLRIYVDLTAFLEGPFNGTVMNTDLSDLTILPVTQPYNIPPWNYTGTESLGIVPLPNKVDWILIELRDAPNASSATPTTVVARKAGIIMNDGSVVNPDGSPNLEFSTNINDQLYVVVWHRNHLGMMSALPLVESGGVYTYNFTTAMGMAYLNGQKSLNGNVYGMYAGDADADGECGMNDIDSYWNAQAGIKGYYSGDFDMNSQVNNQDKNDHWHPNKTFVSQVPE
jgi:hypothetical protein